MPKAYKVRKRKMYFGERKGETLYNVTPVSFGTLTTEDAAKQIAEECRLNPKMQQKLNRQCSTIEY